MTLATNSVASSFRRNTSGGNEAMSYQGWQAHQDANNEALRQAAEERQLEAERRAQDEQHFRTERFWGN
jgi:hypothetical protein